MSVRVALALINQVLDEVLAEHEGEFDADTRWAVAWFEQYGVEAGDFGVAETLSKAKNTSVQGLVDAGVVKSRSGTVQLLSRDELPADWDPIADQRLTEWEATHYLIRASTSTANAARRTCCGRSGATMAKKRAPWPTACIISASAKNGPQKQPRITVW